MPSFNGTIRADLLNGGTLDDVLNGSEGRDTLNGDAGVDRISGGEGADTLNGGAGNDLLYGFGPSEKAAGSGDITATRVGSGLGSPVFAVSAPGDPDRLFIVTKSGLIKILDPATGLTNAAPFLTIPPSELAATGEQGLLSMAFHPDYASNGKFYIYMNTAAGDIEVRQYTRSVTNPDLADPTSGDVILTIAHPGQTNHNGGWMSFGPDGYLYVSVGDGGGGNDPNNNAQNPDVLLGKLLRLDMSGDDFTADPNRDYAIPDDNPFANGAGADEVWAVGLRNPWRPSFDRLTGDLYIADVGQNDREEVNFQAAGSPGGLNYGWAIREGTTDNALNRPGNLPPDSPLLINPLIDYAHVAGPNGGFSVTGGYAYRGTSAGMQGVYFYADYVTDQIWSFRVVDGQATDAANRTAQFVAIGGTVDNIASFGEDGRGNLYIVGLDGEIFLMRPQVAAGDGADLIDGGAGNDRIFGGAGHDTLTGGDDADRLYGGTQDDLIVGGAGVDRMYGGAGADVFDFNAVSESPAIARDVIADFDASIDRLDFSTMDARTGMTGNQQFDYIGTDGFTAEGQIRAVQSGSSVILQVNTTGTNAAEMVLVLRNVVIGDLSGDDFLL